MGRGGSGGSRGGSSHSSGGSRGGSFRSSGSGGRGSGGRSSSSGFSRAGRSTPRMAPPRTPRGYYGRPMGGPPSRRRARMGGPTLGCLTPIFVFVLLIVLIVVFAAAGATGKSQASITKSTVGREPLDKQYVTLTGDWLEDDLGWVRSEATVEQGLRYFYEKTGVVPYLVITDTINGMTSPTGQQCWDYGNEIYDEMFSDEEHLIFVFQCEDGSTDYTMAAVTGAMAKTVVDDEALEILYDYMDYWFNTDPNQVSEDEMFANTFTDAADRIMTVTPNNTVRIVIAVLIVIGLLIAFFIVKAVIKRKREAAAERQRILETPLEKASAPDIDNLEAKYGDEGS